ncbi:hypothetical protein ACFFSW_35880 [Saccharothrix longispora]|uniref:Integral membrane protein n=1 Tax=Saccharothrix longispora TaxID=33920 RepID=A0ABU1PMJ2_9PSEU|nr:hypothetical protein [Saccharothrix longispora]MDR6591886.1 hypothetical protein [Saccharothrix longispora]
MRRGPAIGFGVLLILVGALWTGQGLGYVGGSFMTGQKLWTAIGLLCVVGGGALVLALLRKR